MDIIFIKLLVFALSFRHILGYADISWRDYTGIIPNDAVPGGYDVNNRTTYIGQGFVSNKGIIPGVIYPEEKHITVPSYGTIVIDTYIKILCSSRPNDLLWIPMKADELHLHTINRNLVRGGMENNHVVNLGRLAFQGEVITGKVVSGLNEKPGVAPMYFVYRNDEKVVHSYEVLVYEPLPHDILKKPLLQ